MYKVFSYNDKDEKQKLFSSASLTECCAIAQYLYSASDLELKILDDSDDVVVLFLKPVTK